MILETMVKVLLISLITYHLICMKPFPKGLLLLARFRIVTVVSKACEAEAVMFSLSQSGYVSNCLLTLALKRT